MKIERKIQKRGKDKAGKSLIIQIGRAEKVATDLWLF